MDFGCVGRTAGGIALAVALTVAGAPAKAAFTFSVAEQGSNVVVTGSGTLNLAALTPSSAWGTGPFLQPASGIITTGGVGTWYQGLTGPASFGTGGASAPGSSSGATVGIVNWPVPPFGLYLFVPTGYVSGTSLSNSMTFANATISSLGLSLGTFTWTWGREATADSVTLQVLATPVPEPAAAALLGAALLGLAGVAARGGRLAGLETTAV